MSEYFLFKIKAIAVLRILFNVLIFRKIRFIFVKLVMK